MADKLYFTIYTGQVSYWFVVYVFAELICMATGKKGIQSFTLYFRV